jgi:iron complex outermembrane receptor protein
MFSAVTRAVRTPSRVETDYTTTSLSNPAIPSFVRLQPNPAFTPEELIAYEAGYRLRALPFLYVTASAFFNDLGDTLSTELLTPFAETTPPPPRLILPVTFANGLHGNSHGVEVTGDVRPVSWWRGTVNYSWLRVQMTRDPGSADVSQERRYEGMSPRHQVQFVSSWDLPRRVSVDWFLRSISELPAGPVPSYVTSNIRVAWQPRPQLEIAVVGQDLHDARHLEWPTGAGGNVQIQRSAHVTVIWRR